MTKRMATGKFQYTFYKKKEDLKDSKGDQV